MQSCERGNTSCGAWKRVALHSLPECAQGEAGLPRCVLTPPVGRKRGFSTDTQTLRWGFGARLREVEGNQTGNLLSAGHRHPDGAHEDQPSADIWPYPSVQGDIWSMPKGPRSLVPTRTLHEESGPTADCPCHSVLSNTSALGNIPGSQTRNRLAQTKCLSGRPARGQDGGQRLGDR